MGPYGENIVKYFFSETTERRKLNWNVAIKVLYKIVSFVKWAISQCNILANDPILE